MTNLDTTEFRLPLSLIPFFKAFCNATILHLQVKKSWPHGLKLYTIFAKSLNYADFNALFYDAKNYNEGPMDWENFDKLLNLNLGQRIGITSFGVQFATAKAYKDLAIDFKSILPTKKISNHSDAEFKRKQPVAQTQQLDDNFETPQVSNSSIISVSNDAINPNAMYWH